MIKEIGSNLFIGFYETIFSNSDEFIDDETEDLDILTNLLCCSDDDIDVKYEYNDFNQYKRDVCEIFMNKYIDKIIDVLPSNIINNRNFKFEIKDNITVVSPEYYNYSTDRCYCDIVTNKETLKLIKDYTLSLKGSKQYLIDHYTSYDGFISFLSNDIEYWKSLEVTKYEENMLIGLLDMLIMLSDENAKSEINIDTYYDVDKYTYVTGYCYYNGSKNTVYGLIDKTINKTKSKYPVIFQFIQFDICSY